MALVLGIAPSRMWDEYSDDDIDLLLAARAYESDVDPQTGMLLSEELNPGADPTDYSTPIRFVAEDPVINWGLRAKQDKMDALRKEFGEKHNLNGYVIPIKKVDF